MTIELTTEEAHMLAEDIDYYLTLVHYDWQDAGDCEDRIGFLEALRNRLLAS